jgi:DNA-binding response OmpR family regulator
MTHSDLLIVDDDGATREGLSDLLANAGFTVDTARDGAEALDKMEHQDFSVVLLDVRLPSIGGLDILPRCRGNRRAPKVIIMTGLDTTDVVLAALRRQAYDFVPKPIDFARLHEIVKRAVSSGQEVAPIDVISARPDWVELLVPCTREAADRIQSFLQQLEADLPDEVRDSVGLAFRELLLNGIEWGGQLDPEKKVRVAYLRTRRMLLYRIADPGPGFTFDRLSHAAVQNPPGALDHDLVRNESGLRPGGFGLVLIRAIADELIFNERQNEVVFVKYLDIPGRDAGQAVDRSKEIEASADGLAPM